MAQWRNQGYHGKEGYENFKELLEVPVADAQDLLVDRFPVPRYIVCGQGKGQAQFLLSKLNPSTSMHMSATMYGSTPGAGTGQAIFTDDVSFMEHLKRLVCPVRFVVVSSFFTHLFFWLGCWCIHCYNFSSFHLRTSSSCRTVVSLHPYSTTLIDSAVCFTTMLVTCILTHVFHTCYLHVYLLSITCHASMAYLYINLSVDLAVSLASL